MIEFLLTTFANQWVHDKIVAPLLFTCSLQDSSISSIQIDSAQRNISLAYLNRCHATLLRVIWMNSKCVILTENDTLQKLRQAFSQEVFIGQSQHILIRLIF